MKERFGGEKTLKKVLDKASTEWYPNRVACKSGAKSQRNAANERARKALKKAEKVLDKAKTM